MIRTLRKFNKSLRGSLLIGTIVWVFATVIVVAVVLSVFFRQYTINNIEAELNLHMNQLVAGLEVNESGIAKLAFEPNDPRLQQPFSGLYWQIDAISPDNVVESAVLYSRSLWDQVISPSDIATGILTRSLYVIQSGTIRPQMLAHMKTVYPVEGVDGYRLIMAIDSSALDKPVTRFNWLLFWLLGAMVILLISASLLQQLLSLRSLYRLKQELEQVLMGTNSQIKGSYPTEIQPLVEEFNQVLIANDKIVKQAKAQAGNLAHALKTPLAVLANSCDGKSDQLAILVAEQVAIASRQVEHHLARARAVAAAHSQATSVAVAPVIESIYRVLQRVWAEKNIQLHITNFDRSIAVKADKHDLQEIIGNVLENAFKWARHEVWVSVAINSGSESVVVVQVEDDGTGLPESRHESIFQRGVRMDERTPGSGLGLAIVKDLVQTYGGSVIAYSSYYGGLGIKISLPQAV